MKQSSENIKMYLKIPLFHKNGKKNFFTNLKEKIFYLYCLIIPEISSNLWFEIINISVQYFQLIALPLGGTFKSILKNDNFYENINKVLSYFLIVPFFKYNKTLFYIIFYFLMVLIIFTISLFIYIYLVLNSYQEVHKFILKIIYFILYICTGIFFLPIFFIFFVIFDCSDKKNNFIDDIECEGFFFGVNTILTIVFEILFFLISYVTQTVFFDIPGGPSTYINVSVKNTSKPEVYFLFIKMLSIVIFVICNTNNNSQWVLIVLILSTSFINLYMNKTYDRFTNVNIRIIHKFFSLFYTSISIVIFLGKILDCLNIDFDGCYIILLISIPITAFITLLKEKINISILYLKEDKFNYTETINFIHNFLNLIDLRKNNRKAFIILKGYIVNYENTCNVKHCALKKYLHSLENGVDSTILLYQHIEGIYLYHLKRFNKNNELKISYIYFLLYKIKKEKKAIKLLNDIKDIPMNLENNFMIFRYLKLCQDGMLEINKDDPKNKEKFKEVSYIKYFQRLRIHLKENTKYYINFWSTLLLSVKNGEELLKGLYENATKILNLSTKIERIFNKLQKIKNNDLNVLKIYSDYLNFIQNDMKTANEYYDILIENEDYKNNLQNLDITKVNINLLNKNDEYQYIIVNAKGSNFGNIYNISLGSCEIFGYNKYELVGKNLNILIPDIYQKDHDKILVDRLLNYRKDDVDEDNINKKGDDEKTKKNNFTKLKQTYNKNIKELMVFGINKSKYLIEIYLKNTVLETEDNNIFFIAAINKEYVYYNTKTMKDINQYCCVLTDTKLVIRNFTPNSVTFLGIDSTFINAGIEISFFIRQFYEEMIFRMNKKDEKLSPEQKMKIKKNILDKKFRYPLLVNWGKIGKNRMNVDGFQKKFESVNKLIEINMKSFKKTIREMTNEKEEPYIIDDNPEKIFILSIRESKINNKLVGYIFKFEKINNSNRDNFNTNNIQNLNGMNKYLNNKKGNGKKSAFLSNVSSYESHYLENTHLNSDLDSKRSSIKSFNNDINFTPFNNLHITNKFIPDSKVNFQFNIKDLAYKPKKDFNDKLKETLKQKVLDKLNVNNNFNSTSHDKTSTEHEEETSSPSSSIYQSSSGASSLRKLKETNSIDHNKYSQLFTKLKNNEVNQEDKINNKRTYELNSGLNIDKKKEILSTILKKSNSILTIKNHNLDKSKNDYYKVNMNCIFLFKYDYYKNCVVEDENFDKIYQIEKRLNEIPKSAQTNQNNINSEENNLLENAVEKSLQKNDGKDFNLQNNIFSTEEYIYKQIKFALHKKNSYSEFNNFKFFSFFTFFIYLFNGFFIYFFIMKNLKVLKTNSKMINNSYLLSVYNTYIIYYVREIILLNNENYTNFPARTTREIFYERIVNETFKIYAIYNDLITEIFQSFISLSNKNNYIVNSRNLIVENIQSDYSTFSSEINVHVCFIQISAALFEICKSSKLNLIPTNQNVFFFFYNILNTVGNSTLEMGEALLDEIELKIKQNKKLFNIYIMIIIIIVIITFLSLLYIYQLVIQKKNNYLNIFFDIGIDSIKTSLEKSEFYLSRLQDDILNEHFNEDMKDDDEDEKKQKSNEEKDFLINKQKTPFVKKRKNLSNDLKPFIFKYCLFIIVLLLYYLFLINFLFHYMNIILISENYFKNELLIENEFYYVFVFFREFFFEPDIKISGQSSKDILEYHLDNLYVIRKRCTGYMNANRAKLPYKFKARYINVKNHKPCYWMLDNYFYNESECLKFMSSAANKGFNVMTNLFVEQIREFKNMYQSIRIANKYKCNNLTMTGTKEWMNKWPSDINELENYIKNDPINYFNNQISFELNVMFTNLIITYFSELKETTLFVINKFLNSYKQKYSLNLIVYELFLLLLFLLLWLPFLKKLKILMHKTKNMISIIPKETLVKLNSVHHLFHIKKDSKEKIEENDEKKEEKEEKDEKEEKEEKDEN